MKSAKLLVKRETIYLTKELRSFVPVDIETNVNLKIATQKTVVINPPTTSLKIPLH